MKSPLKLQQLLPQDTSNFFTYNGSLTTPPCNEVVIWSIFTQPFFITTSQVKLFAYEAWDTFIVLWLRCFDSLVRKVSFHKSSQRRRKYDRRN